ncbi:MAG: glutathione S-transferase [Gammaproteobacteria bacterium]|nr:glutathione S-transferase [Gammaproteobacteria bacterium]
MHKLYAISHSLYSGRARSYLIKAGIPFQELSTGHESFKNEVLPKAGLPTIPTLLTPQGEVIRDGAKIIDHFEAQNGHAFQPTGIKQHALSLLFDVIGAEGLVRPAMHYRWNFLEQNESFSHYHFLHSQRLTDSREQKTQYMMGRMKTVAGLWGVIPERHELIETLYLELLQKLNQHFEQLPYLFGWRPSIGDFGLIAPLYAHLGRDPMPATLMKQQAVRVYRWVERMNRPDQDAPEYFDAGDDYLADDEIPPTMIDVLRLLSEDFVPETEAHARAINQWLSANQPQAGTPAERFLDKAEFELRGQAIESVSQPYRFALLQRVQAVHDSLEPDQKSALTAVFEQCGMAALLNIRLNRTLGWENNLDIWL